MRQWVGLAGALMLAACGQPVAEREALPATAAPVAAAAPPPAIEVRRMAGENMHAMILPAGTTRDAAVAAARRACGAGPFCQVGGWVDATLVPGGYPMSEAESASQVFRFNVNRTTNYQAVFVKCDLFDEKPGDECM